MPMLWGFIAAVFAILGEYLYRTITGPWYQYLWWWIPQQRIICYAIYRIVNSSDNLIQRRPSLVSLYPRTAFVHNSGPAQRSGEALCLGRLHPDSDHQSSKGGVEMSEIRMFETGATRDTETGKYDYEGFLSPLVLERFAEYMHKNRYMKDGSLRASDNWQSGIPLHVYMSSTWRHFMAWWMGHRRWTGHGVSEDDLCGVMFNVMGYLHELIKDRK